MNTRYSNSKYLDATYFIDSDHPSMQEKSKEVTGNKADIISKAKSLFYFVRDEIRYNLYAPRILPEHFVASETLRRGTGYCVQKAVLLAALARAAGIPAGLGFARLRNNLLSEKMLATLGTNILPFHGYTEFHLNGNKVKATPAFDLRLCEKHNFVPVEFDGEHDAMFSPYNRDGKPHIEYVKYLGHYDDLPIDMLWDVMLETYGARAPKSPKQEPGQPL